MSARLAAAVSELVEALREELRQEADAAPRTPDRLLSIPEAAEAMSIGRTTLYGLIGQGRIRTVRAGRRVLVPANAIAEYVREAA